MLFFWRVCTWCYVTCSNCTDLGPKTLLEALELFLLIVAEIYAHLDYRPLPGCEKCFRDRPEVKCHLKVHQNKKAVAGNLEVCHECSTYVTPGSQVLILRGKESWLDRLRCKNPGRPIRVWGLLSHLLGFLHEPLMLGRISKVEESSEEGEMRK
ncbi:zinc finger protein 57-like [Cricetulus griseus]|uniref:zinc finger protein 57-like n=1 Tax=Cricetulus griseus TaxID=10029 RepID=UPI0004547F36|nr:zinc finger protein 57-like [Cricetulus griseus]